MAHCLKFSILSCFLYFFCGSGALAQPWTFAKERDGIKVYTRFEPNRSWKSFKGDVTFQASLEKVYSLLGNNKNNDWWDKAITNIKVLGYEDNKFIQYYLVFNLPWPFKNRDIVAETIISTDTLSGVRTYTAKPLSGKVPEKSNLVRLKEYQQIWTVQPEENGFVHVTIEGSVNPGGNIPAWLFNMVITETPLKMLRSFREKLLSGQNQLSNH